MIFYPWILFIHITGVVIYVGGDILLNVLAFRASEKSNIEEFLSIANSASPVIGTGAILTILGGVGLVLYSAAWSFLSFWIVAGLVMLVIAGTAESVYFKMKLKRISLLLSTQGPETPEITTSLYRLVRVGAVINVLFIIVIWLMIFKPAF